MLQRTITAIIAGVIFIALLFQGGVFFYLSTLALAALGLFELIRMRNNHQSIIIMTFAYLVLGLVFGQYIISYDFLSSSGVIFVLITALSIPVITKNKINFEDMAFALLTSLYLAIGFYSLHIIRLDMSLAYTLMILLAVWATDTGAYLTGYAFRGRGPKLWEAISPKKTVVGAIGGTIAAILVVIFFQSYIDYQLSLAFQILLGIIIAFFGQLGDLAASACKRFYQVKDSGTILPGHGGILDRFDSILFVFPIIYIITINFIIR